MSGYQEKMSILLSILLSFFLQKKNVSSCLSHTIAHGYIIDEEKNPLDEILCMIMHGPKSFTGEHTLEINCHNNQLIIEAIIRRLCQLGCRPAEPGEFTRRALRNKRITISQAEAVNEILKATTAQAVTKSLMQLQGSLSEHINIIDNQLYKINAWIQASFEFLEEERDFTSTIKTMVLAIIKDIETIIAHEQAQKIVTNGIKIGIIGTVNAGKSSLFNALIEQEKAIVTSIAGTTRDVVESTIINNGIPITFFDTAGIRLTNDSIEKIGIEKSFDIAHRSDVILLVFDGIDTIEHHMQNTYKNLIEHYREKIIFIINKNDMFDYQDYMQKKNHYQDVFKEQKVISTNTKKNVAIAWTTIKAIIEEKIQQASLPFIINKRHIQTLIFVKQHLNTIYTLIDPNNPSFEIISLLIVECQQSLSELSGNSISNTTMDTIFKEFCVGK